MGQYLVGEPLERVAIDILGPLPRTEKGNKYVVVISDYFTRWIEAYPVKNQEAMTIARVFVEEFVSRYGVPLQVHTDQGRQFESTLFQDLCSMLKIDKTRTTPFNPKSDGLVERFNRTLEDMISKYVQPNQRNWDEVLPLMMLAYKSSVHDTTGYSPAKLNLGRELKLPVDLVYGQNPRETSHFRMFKCTTCFRMYPNWRKLSRHIRDKHDKQPIPCKNASLGCVMAMPRSRKSQLMAHEAKCKYDPIHGGPKTNPRIHNESTAQESRESTPVRDERPFTPSPRSCVALFQMPDAISPLPSSTVTCPTEPLVVQPNIDASMDVPLTSGVPEYGPLTLITTTKEGLDHLQNVETAFLPDGTTYKLQSVWYRTSVTTKTVSTQTEEDIPRPEKVDAHTQCSVRLQLID
ncbi:uncharacterized protein LOC130048813 [Ostrea edulis]|uniref:uncharacterized protein LOC130048813 n=1 Tax=Ostrea edulis TaxID=37623 RepID=UPI0024AEA1C5|nr:uncharacterized protein LOC130048813 [Ostrea edulis]